VGYEFPSKAVVVGGGLGGLFAAVALARRGWSVTVYEQAPDLRMFGAGIWLWENGLRALESIGALEHATYRAQRISAWEITDSRGRVLRRREASPWDRLIVPPRADLYDALISQAEHAGVNIVTDAPVASADPGGRVTLRDGTVIDADFVVAADGINSSIREGLGLTKKLTTLGNGAIRVLIPRTERDTTDLASENWSGNRGLLYNPISNEHVYLCLACPVSDERGRSVPVDRDSWAESFPHLSEPIRRIGNEGRWDVLKTVTVHGWSKGRVAVIGDACHGQPPWLGQAANLTFGNALALAEFVTGVSDVPGALEAWERYCRPVTDHTASWTNAYGRVVDVWPPSLERVRSRAVRTFVSTPGVEAALNRAQREQVSWEMVRSAQRWTHDSHLRLLEGSGGLDGGTQA
jgi:2-polyprenyl-6-methoxyphenol hydroxylase-like FAD-dependent oxidoreductase